MNNTALGAGTLLTVFAFSPICNSEQWTLSNDRSQCYNLQSTFDEEKEENIDFICRQFYISAELHPLPDFPSAQMKPGISILSFR